MVLEVTGGVEKDSLPLGSGPLGWRSLAKHELLELFSGTPWSIAVTRHLPRDQSPSGENLTLGTRNAATG